MACDCNNYIDCGDKPIETAYLDAQSSYNHRYSQTSNVSGMPFELDRKVTREFTVSFGHDGDTAPDYIIACDTREVCPGEQPSYFCHCSESCVMEVNVPYYLDRQRGIVVWKNIREELSWSLSSDKTASFRMKWGDVKMNKLCIPKSVRTVGTESFFMTLKGETRELASVNYSYNPFPETEAGGATWGLYGNVTLRTATPDTENVACILIFPTVPKQAIALDNDVIAYGFYDYNSVEGGFIVSSLTKDDGGQDYFYPYWCRSMPPDPLWRRTADYRYGVLYGRETVPASSPWAPPEPTTYPWPFGSFALDSRQNFIASCILQFGEHAGSRGVVYNEAGMGDLFTALTTAGISPRGAFTALHPVTPL